MTLPEDERARSKPSFPFLSASALAPPVLSVLAWMLLEWSADSLEFLAGVAMAIVFASGVVLCFGGVLAALISRRVGEHPRSLGTLAIVLNFATVLWLVSVLR